MSEAKTPDQIKFPAPKTLRPPKNLLNHIRALQAHAGLIPRAASPHRVHDPMAKNTTPASEDQG
jgi:hypothetical protein